MRRGVLLPLLLAACASVPAASGPVTGDWGGPHVGLHLGPTGGTLEYDCAAGTIGPVIPGRGGRFVADGTHTPGWGGPEIAGQVRPTYRARFSGSVSGDRMTMAGRVANGVDLGPFTLRSGAEPGIFRCL
ncbi:MAG TPA: hypothetical protein VFY95_04005 [Sphingomicrobium sp.]